MKMNYTGVCWYCGEIFKSNRSTANYCCNTHRSLYNINGSMINPFINDEEGKLVEAEEMLLRMLDRVAKYRGDGWSCFFSLKDIRDKFNYRGPVPNDNSFLVVSCFIIGLFDDPEYCNEPMYSVKRINRLTKWERGTGKFVKAE